ncbi:DUF4301 family protein [Flavobacteriaceae bacterium R38]|nr:DUF4301 family protein [Flavobacteriaceae bacterium R38]
MMIFTEKDKELLKNKGITTDKIASQIATFNRGIPFVDLISSATKNKGICKLSVEEEQYYKSLFEQKKDKRDLLKFVPASGAASRMFKALFNFISDFNPDEQSFNDYIKKEGTSGVAAFFENIERFSFYAEINSKIATELSDDHRKLLFVKEMLLKEGLDFGQFPKGLLPFHQYDSTVVTAFEEHLYEAALYNESNGKSALHFTISEHHTEKFSNEFERIKTDVEKATKVNFEVSFSYQKASTDTVAVTPENELFRNDDESLLFRPSGHGALIENLNEQDADIIFIKNIDNVVVERFREEISDCKKILAGKLLGIQEKAFGYATLLEDDTKVSESKIEEIRGFLEKELNVSFANDFNAMSNEEQLEFFKRKINRPIRVCGMVKNEGEPGGGPFWVKDEKGNTSLQIIESAQIDTSNASQQEILQQSTHFNPVDLVCGIRNHQGKKYNLMDFVDPTQGFITSKTSQGRDLKALELPGLWNGAMAYWNTIFVEVPLITFNPVKTINDLLKATHQVK